MAPVRRRARRGLRYWVRNGRQRPSAQDSIGGEKTRRVLDSYCPFCATDIRSGGPRRIVRCPNTALCGKPLPIEDCCPNCSHYTRPGDNFCRVCRGSLRNVVRGRGGLYQALRRVPSPSRNPSPPREEVRRQGDNMSGSDNDDQDDDANGITDSDNDDPAPHNPGPALLGRGGGGGGFLRIARIDDE